MPWLRRRNLFGRASGVVAVAIVALFAVCRWHMGVAALSPGRTLSVKLMYGDLWITRFPSGEIWLIHVDDRLIERNSFNLNASYLPATTAVGVPTRQAAALPTPGFAEWKFLSLSPATIYMPAVGIYEQTFRMPIWYAAVPFATLMLLTEVHHRRRLRRGRIGICATCGYDLAGIAASAVCPECGKGAGEKAA